MKMSLVMFAMLTLASTAFARDPKCKDYLKDAAQAVVDAQEKLANGTGTLVGVLGAKSAQADVLFSCTPWVKYKYCERKITLLNSMISRLPGLIDNGQATQGELDEAKDTRKSMVYYCTHPAAPRP